MIERDYIMRMIDSLAKVLARALFLQKSLDYLRAADELAAASKNLLGLDRDVIRLMDDEQLITLLNADGSIGGSKCYVLGMLLKEEASLESTRGNAGEALTLVTKSVGLLTEAFIRAEGPVVPSHPAAIDELISSFGVTDHSPKTMERLFLVYEKTGRFDKAEDILFNLIDRDPDSIAKGFEFYRRLSSKDDDSLERGNLPRREVEEAIQELHERSRHP